MMLLKSTVAVVATYHVQLMGMNAYTENKCKDQNVHHVWSTKSRTNHQQRPISKVVDNALCNILTQTLILENHKPEFYFWQDLLF